MRSKSDQKDSNSCLSATCCLLKSCEIEDRSLSILPGVGQHPSNNWPGEQSVLVLGLSLEAAKTLGRRFDQNAVVLTGRDGIPQLVLDEQS